MEPKGVPMIAWASEPGRIYQVQYKDASDARAWSDLGDPVVAGEGFVTGFVDPTRGPAGQRFYRVLLTP